jgi:hypothetical protein
VNQEMHPDAESKLSDVNREVLDMVRDILKALFELEAMRPDVVRAALKRRRAVCVSEKREGGVQAIDRLLSCVPRLQPEAAPPAPKAGGRKDSV